MTITHEGISYEVENLEFDDVDVDLSIKTSDDISQVLMSSVYDALVEKWYANKKEKR